MTKVREGSTVVLVDSRGNRWTGTFRDGYAAGVNLRASAGEVRIVEVCRDRA